MQLDALSIMMDLIHRGYQVEVWERSTEGGGGVKEYCCRAWKRMSKPNVILSAQHAEELHIDTLLTRVARMIKEQEEAMK